MLTYPMLFWTCLVLPYWPCPNPDHDLTSNYPLSEAQMQARLWCKLAFEAMCFVLYRVSFRKLLSWEWCVMFFQILLCWFSVTIHFYFPNFWVVFSCWIHLQPFERQVHVVFSLCSDQSVMPLGFVQIKLSCLWFTVAVLLGCACCTEFIATWRPVCMVSCFRLVKE